MLNRSTRSTTIRLTNVWPREEPQEAGINPLCMSTKDDGVNWRPETKMRSLAPTRGRNARNGGGGGGGGQLKIRMGVCTAQCVVQRRV